MAQDRFICCRECDEIVKIPYPHKKGRYKCPNCKHTLFKYWPDMIKRVYAISLASLVLLILTSYFPFLSFEVMGNKTEINFFTGAYYLYKNQDFILAVTLLLTTIFIPFLWILNMVLIFGSIYHHHIPKFIIYFLKLQYIITPWGMLDVYLVGILVSIVKLVKLGTIITGVALWSFVILVILVTYIQSIYDPHIIWDIVDKEFEKDKIERD